MHTHTVRNMEDNCAHMNLNCICLQILICSTYISEATKEYTVQKNKHIYNSDNSDYYFFLLFVSQENKT